MGMAKKAEKGVDGGKTTPKKIAKKASAKNGTGKKVGRPAGKKGDERSA